MLFGRLGDERELHIARLRVDLPLADDGELVDQAKRPDLQVERVPRLIAHEPDEQRERDGSELAPVDQLIRDQLAGLFDLLDQGERPFPRLFLAVRGDVGRDPDDRRRDHFPPVLLGPILRDHPIEPVAVRLRRRHAASADQVRLLYRRQGDAGRVDPSGQPRAEPHALAAAGLRELTQDVPLVIDRIDDPADLPAVRVCDVHGVDERLHVDRLDALADTHHALAVLPAPQRPRQGMAPRIFRGRAADVSRLVQGATRPAATGIRAVLARIVHALADRDDAVARDPAGELFPVLDVELQNKRVRRMARHAEIVVQAGEAGDGRHDRPRRGRRQRELRPHPAGIGPLDGRPGQILRG